jgi:hypothetical protein
MNTKRLYLLLAFLLALAAGLFLAQEATTQGVTMQGAATGDHPQTTIDQIQASPEVTVTIFLPLVPRNYPPPPQADLYIEALQYETTDEYVQITNRGNAPQDMTGWRIQSIEGPQWYYFPAAYTLAAGASVRVHSGPDAFDNPPTDLLWGLAHVWLNEGDKAILYDDSFTEIDSFCYLDGCP